MAIQRDKIVASAEKLVAKGKVEAAIKEYDRLLDDNPNDVNTLNRIGDLWVRITRTDEAVKVFTRIADHYAKDGFFLKAIAIFKKINKLDPSKLEIYAKLADLYAKQGLAMEAKGQYQVLADYYQKHGDPENALKTIRKIAELDPNSINVHVKLADLYSQNGKTAEALKEYDRVGRMLLKRGMMSEAVQVFRKALKIDPSNIELAESLANTLIEAKDFANAQQILEGAHESNPDNVRLLSLLGKVYIGKGELPAAERMLAEAVAQNPGEASVAELLADLYLRKGKTDAALNILEPIVDAASAKGERTAVEILQRILRVDAGHIPTLEKLVGVYRRLNEETNILSSMNSLAEAHISAGGFSAASGVLEDLLRREPQNAQHREKLAFVKARLSGGPAPEAAPPPPPPASAPPPMDEDFSIGLDGDAMDLGFEPPPMPPPPRIEPSRPAPEASDQDAEDLDFITEQLTEAEVFAKYGLTEKAVEHLKAVIDRSPGNLAAYDKLLHLHLDEGDSASVAEVGAIYLGLLANRGDSATAESVRAELLSRGHTIGDAVLPAAVEDDADVEEIPVEASWEEPADEEVELSVSDDSPDISFDTGSIDMEEEESGLPEATAEIEEIEETETETAVEALEEETVELEQELAFEEKLPEEEEIRFDTDGEIAIEEEVELETEEAPVEPPQVHAAEQLEVEAEEAELAPEPEAYVPPAQPAMEELGEIDFYIEQDLIEEAESRITALEERFPGNTDVSSRRETLEARRKPAPQAAAPEPVEAETDLLSAIREGVEEEITAPAAAEANLFDEEDDFFDLAAELEQELSDEEEPITISEEEQSLEEIFKEFKRGVEQQLDAEDYDTHYNLGIAYKEMGLIDEAIGEFQLASKDPKRMIECCSMLGLCFLEKGMPQLAIKWYQKGLEAPEIGDDEHLGLLYDLGNAYLEVGDTANAQKAFMEVYGINSNYRDIVGRIKQLEDVAR